jgi:hypothetical protein
MALPIAVSALIAQNNRVETALQFATLIQSTLVQYLPGQLIKLELS